MKRFGWGLVVAWVVAALSGCGLRNIGETCPKGPVGDFLCAPGLCDPGTEQCVECLSDVDCLKQDPYDRPRCEPAIPISEGGDGKPFCRHIADHPSCTIPGTSALCAPGQCHPDAGVCVECMEDGDCSGGRVCRNTGVDNLPGCVDKDE